MYSKVLGLVEFTFDFLTCAFVRFYKMVSRKRKGIMNGLRDFLSGKSKKGQPKKGGGDPPPGIRFSLLITTHIKINKSLVVKIEL